MADCKHDDERIVRVVEMVAYDIETIYWNEGKIGSITMDSGKALLLDIEKMEFVCETCGYVEQLTSEQVAG